jgi:hypothetical protein
VCQQCIYTVPRNLTAAPSCAADFLNQHEIQHQLVDLSLLLYLNCLKIWDLVDEDNMGPHHDTGGLADTSRIAHVNAHGPNAHDHPHES